LDQSEARKLELILDDMGFVVGVTVSWSLGSGANSTTIGFPYTKKGAESS